MCNRISDQFFRAYTSLLCTNSPWHCLFKQIIFSCPLQKKTEEEIGTGSCLSVFIDRFSSICSVYTAYVCTCACFVRISIQSICHVDMCSVWIVQSIYYYYYSLSLYIYNTLFESINPNSFTYTHTHRNHWLSSSH